MTILQEQLTTAFPDLSFQLNYPLATQTYFKVGGPAELYLELADRKQIISLVKFCQVNHFPITILGGGSNVVISDEGVAGLVLKLTNDDFSIINQEDEETIVRAGAGLKTALLVRKTIDAGLTGLEYFLGVPGNLGGAIYNNAHYLQDLISKHVYRVEIINAAGEVEWLTNEQCKFAYDASRFQQTAEVILQAEFHLLPGLAEKSQELIKQATLYRSQTQPLGLPSSGCIFQNTPNTPGLKTRFPQFADRSHVPSGFLIDQAGLKNEREGDIEVSDKHAAFFVNRGAGKASDIQKLIERVKSVVREKFGVDLQEEVFWLGKS
ncbi:MAG: UDP-N-acetylmuramate dehydrogenase [Candidatus Paceibacterota bacterium]